MQACFREHAAAVNGKPWKYPLVPHDEIVENKRLVDYPRFENEGGCMTTILPCVSRGQNSLREEATRCHDQHHEIRLLNRSSCRIMPFQGCLAAADVCDEVCIRVT